MTRLSFPQYCVVRWRTADGGRVQAGSENPDEDRNVERQRHSRPPGGASGLARAGTAGRGVSAGDQGVTGSAARLALRPRRLLVLLAWVEGLFRRGPARQP